MIEKKTLRTIVTKNWDNIAKTLKLDIENRPENVLLMLSHLRPYLDSAATAFPRPSIAVYSSVKQEYLKNIFILEKMGFVDGTTYQNSFGLTLEGFDLMECYHKSINPNYLTESELIDKIIANADHLQYGDDTNNDNNVNNGA
jgi:hypothetical protein